MIFIRVVGILPNPKSKNINNITNSTKIIFYKPSPFSVPMCIVSNVESCHKQSNVLSNAIIQKYHTPTTSTSPKSVGATQQLPYLLGTEIPTVWLAKVAIGADCKNTA